jgi:hypothetical protein
VCANTAALATAQFLPDGTIDPVLKTDFGTVVYATGVITFTGGPRTATTGCIVTLTPTVLAGTAGGSTVSWIFANTTPTVCNRTKTGVGA